MSERVGLGSIAVRGIWLRREGNYAVVLAEIGSQWVEIIREHADGDFSHICEPKGIAAKIEQRAGVTSGREGE